MEWEVFWLPRSVCVSCCRFSYSHVQTHTFSLLAPPLWSFTLSSFQGVSCSAVRMDLHCSYLTVSWSGKKGKKKPSNQFHDFSSRSAAKYWLKHRNNVDLYYSNNDVSSALSRNRGFQYCSLYPENTNIQKCETSGIWSRQRTEGFRSHLHFLGGFKADTNLHQYSKMLCFEVRIVSIAVRTWLSAGWHSLFAVITQTLGELG